MGNLTINGNVANATSAATIITVAGPKGYTHQETKEGNFSIPLGEVGPGIYSIYIHGITDGAITINIVGDITSVDPNVPKTLQGEYSQIFHADVRININEDEAA